MPNRSSDFSTQDTYQWLKKEFPGHQRDAALVEGITAEVVRAYGNGRDDGLATAAEIIIEDMRRERCDIKSSTRV